MCQDVCRHGSKTSSTLSDKRKAILKSQNKIPLLVMAGKFCIYSNVHNVLHYSWMHNVAYGSLRV